MGLQLILSGLTIGALYGLIAVGMIIIFNVTGKINLAQGEFVVLAGLLATTLSTLGVPMWAIFIITIIFAGLTAGLLERLFVRPLDQKNVLTVVIVTLGIGVILRGIALLFWGPDVRSMPPFVEGFIYIGQASIQWQVVLALVVNIILLLFMWYFFNKTYSGKIVQANVMNQFAARLMGIRSSKLSFWVFVITGALSGLAGLLISPIIGMSYSVGLPLIIKGLIVSIIGGLTNPYAAILTGFLLGIIESLTAGYISSGYSNVISVLLLIAILFVRPAGLFGKEEIKRV